MKVHFQRAAAFLLAVMLSACCLAVPALANDTPVDSTGTIWSALYKDVPWLCPVIGLAPSVCPVSEDARHHGKVIARVSSDSGSAAGKWQALCDNCGDFFYVYDDAMQGAYGAMSRKSTN